ncbi:hypothetical protein D3C86_958700 [compost metagenome]
MPEFQLNDILFNGQQILQILIIKLWVVDGIDQHEIVFFSHRNDFNTFCLPGIDFILW